MTALSSIFVATDRPDLYVIAEGGVNHDGSVEDVLAHLAAHDVDARALWRPLHAQPPYAAAEVVGGAVSDELFARGLSPPCSTDLDEPTQARVIAATLDYFG